MDTSLYMLMTDALPPPAAQCCSYCTILSSILYYLYVAIATLVSTDYIYPYQELWLLRPTVYKLKVAFSSLAWGF